MLIRQCSFLFSLLLVGCLGDGGGTAYQSSPVGTEAPADQGGPFDVGPEDGSNYSGSSGSSDNGNEYALCMELCTEETDEEYCREEVCDELGGAPPGGGPPAPNGNAGNVDYCEDFTAEELAVLDSLPPACGDCICSTDPLTADETACTQECGL